jgi:S-DNA-T family DNA segregation ATPase FtsK/SpoIIIE
VAVSAGAAETTSAPAAKPSHGYAKEAAALVLLAAALYIVLALLSFRGDPMRPEVVGADWVGPVGALAARAVVGTVGLAAWLVPVELALLAAPLLNGQRSRVSVARLAGDLVVLLVLAALAHVALPDVKAFGAMPLGGSVGELFGELMRGLFSAIGSYIVGFTIVGLILIGRATFSFIEWTRTTRRAAAALGERSAGGLSALAGAWSAARELDRQQRQEERRAAEPFIALPTSADAIIAELADDGEGFTGSEPPPPSDGVAMVQLASPGELPPVFLDATPTPAPAPAARRRAAGPPATRVVAPPLSEPETPEPAEPELIASPRLAALDDVPTPSPIMPVRELAPQVLAPVAKPAPEPVLKIVATPAALVTEKAAPARVVPAIGRGFRLPSPDLLDPAGASRIIIDEEQLKATAQLLEKTLADYGVSGKVEEIHPGPTVTTFEVSPAAGTKVSKVASLADDLALGLSRKVRIIAPIPGKNRIGFEIPNPERTPVNLRELVEDRRFIEMKAPLPCVMGRDIIGAPYYADLASMPHVIVAGATGAGKSVGLNVMLISLLTRRTPDELRLLMIDPKVVELAPFDRIPHMLLPVVTDMKQAANALKWAVDEMERRYQLFANAGTKNITTYNGWVERVKRGEARPPKPPAKVAAVGFDGTEVEIDAAKDGSDAELPDKLPYIVIVVDEFADLMMQQGKEVEASVARLAQKARAAGMHVILATQRPSVDVITGMIKANFPTRIAFRVAQKVDSRTILDEQGAEHLLGRGDMLVKMNGANDTRRVQCPFCSEEEVQRVNDFLRLQGEPVYDEAILKPRDEEGDAPDTSDAENDAMYDAAVRIVADTRRCSTSWIQRKLGIGYNRAAKLVEAMEKRGLVGPANGAKDREILISSL